MFPAGGYILDVDLDYFQTRKSIEPEDARTFYRLIRESGIITVALEPACVESGRLEGETITSDFLLARLLEHIEKAALLHE